MTEYQEQLLIDRGFKELLDDIEKGKINLVIVKDLSRFGRNSAQVAYYLEEYFVEKYRNVYQEIDSSNLCFNYAVVIELLDVSELDDVIRDIINE